MTTRLVVNSCAFALTGVVSVVLGFACFSPQELPWLIQKESYWVLLVAFLGFGFALYRLLREPQSWESLKGIFTPARLMFVVVVTGACFLFQPSGFKVVMDEPVLMATSHQLHTEKEMFTPTRCYRLGGVFYSLDGYVDKRPGFYPFLVSLFHDFTGYRSSQGVLVNALITPVFFLLVAWAGNLLNPRWGFFVAPLLALSVPLVSVNANGSGFDLLNLTLILVTFLLSVLYLKGQSGARLDALLFASVLLAHTRYESAIYVLPVGIVVLWAFLRSRVVNLTLWSAAVPLLLIPVAHLYRMIQSNPDHMQVREGDSVAFALGYLSENLTHAFNYFFHFGAGQPNSFLLSIGFLVSLVMIAVCLIKRSRLRELTSRSAATVPVVVWSGFILGTFALVLCYHWGQLDDFAATRLALPFILLQILCVTGTLSVFQRSDGLNVVFLVALLLYLTAVTRPVCASTNFFTQYNPTREALWIQERVLSMRGENALFVTQKRLIPVIERMSGISIGDALGAKAELNFHLQLGTFNGIYFFHSRLSETTDPGDLNETLPVSENFELAVIDRYRLDPYSEVVFSKLQDVRFEDNDRREVDLSAYEGIDDPTEWLALVRTTLP